MGTVNELQVGDGARVRVGFELNWRIREKWRRRVVGSLSSTGTSFSLTRRVL